MDKIEKIRKEKKKLWKLRNDVKAKIRKLKKQESETLELIRSECKRKQLPEDMEPKDFMALLRKYRGISQYCWTNQRRDPIRHGEIYDFYCEMKDKWTIGDIHELIKQMQRVMRLSKEKAIAKLVVDMAEEYIVLYQYFMGIDGYFEKFVDKAGKPVSITKLNVLY